MSDRLSSLLNRKPYRIRADTVGHEDGGFALCLGPIGRAIVTAGQIADWLNGAYRMGVIAASESAPGWQPMSSAPKNERVLVRLGPVEPHRHSVTVAKWGNIGWGNTKDWHLCDLPPYREDDHEVVKPLGWMPLPTP